MVSAKLLKTKVEIVQTSYSFIDGCFILWSGLLVPGTIQAMGYSYVL